MVGWAIILLPELHEIEVMDGSRRALCQPKGTEVVLGGRKFD